MKLEKYSKNSKQKKIIIGSIIALILLVGGITLYRTFALYEEKKEFNILKGRVPNFMSADVSLAFVVNDVPSEKVPAKGNYIVDVTCDGGYGEWDYTAWDIVIRSFANGTKCDVTFTSVTEEEMPEFKTIKKVTKRANATYSLCTDCVNGPITFDFSEIPGYENLTVDNFIATVRVGIYVTGGEGWVGTDISSIEYDSSRGIVTVKYYLHGSNTKVSSSVYSYVYVTAFYY